MGDRLVNLEEAKPKLKCHLIVWAILLLKLNSFFMAE